MTIQEILNESFYIKMSLSNLDIKNESMKDLFSKGASAVKSMLDKFIVWIKETIIPFLTKMYNIVIQLLKKIKNKKGNNAAAKENPSRSVENIKDLNGNNISTKGLSFTKKDILKYPTWVNTIAHNIIPPGAVINLANSTEDRSSDIIALGEKIDKYLSDGAETKIVVGVDVISEAKKQLECLQKGIETFKANYEILIKKCEEIRRQIVAIPQGNSMRLNNIAAIIELMTRKNAEVLKLSAENIVMLKKLIDPF